MHGSMGLCEGHGWFCVCVTGIQACLCEGLAQMCLWEGCGPFWKDTRDLCRSCLWQTSASVNVGFLQGYTCVQVSVSVCE